MKYSLLFILIILLIIYSGCAGTRGGLKSLPEPASNTTMVIGAVLIENINLSYPFDNWDLPLQVVLLGKDEGGTISHHTVYTSNEGYYCLPNVPTGSYLLKAVIFQESGTLPEIIVNDWEDANSKYNLLKHPERGIEYTAEWFPQPPKSNITNHKIAWFGLRSRNLEDTSDLYKGEVIYNVVNEEMQAKRMWRDGYPYTIQNPLTYFKNKFPLSGWWDK
jgi:hypothetical protein